MRELRQAAVDEIEATIRDLWPADGRAHEQAEAIEACCAEYDVPISAAKAFLVYHQVEHQELTLAWWRRVCKTYAACREEERRREG